MLHQPAAHTDGDTVVFFRRSDVVVAGHILDATRFPVIDVARGGSIQGEIAALNRLIQLAIPAGPYLGTPNGAIETSTAVLPGGTEVLTGRGRVYRQIDVVDYRDMVVIITRHDPAHDRPEDDARADQSRGAGQSVGAASSGRRRVRGPRMISSRPSTRA